MISCNVNNCSHNSSGTCCANSINVGGKGVSKAENTCCGSFLDKANYSNLTNSYSSSGTCESISCNAGNCKYNSNESCTAKNIEINGAEVNLYSETNCQTFELK